MVKYPMLVDEISLVFKGGDGGEGKVSFGKFEKSGPDGGNGGNGGSLKIVASSDLTLLSQFHPDEVVSAENGEPGRKDKKAGRKGGDLIIKLPVGTTVTDNDTSEQFELTSVGQEILLAQGGVGGVGNFDLRSPSNTTPKNTIPATKGQVRRVKVTLRFIADYGLVGLPSAGKSSLLNELTMARAKTGEYHFTTLSPNLGVLPNRKIIADIPGLIEGAHQGRGLGAKFLKHIEKVDLLLHCISVDSADILRDYEIIRKEIGKYSKDLLNKNEVILLTKTDLVSREKISELEGEFKKAGHKVLSVSIYDYESIKKLTRLL